MLANIVHCHHKANTAATNFIRNMHSAFDGVTIILLQLSKQCFIHTHMKSTPKLNWRQRIVIITRLLVLPTIQYRPPLMVMSSKEHKMTPALAVRENMIAKEQYINVLLSYSIEANSYIFWIICFQWLNRCYGCSSGSTSDERRDNNHLGDGSLSNIFGLNRSSSPWVSTGYKIVLYCKRTIIQFIYILWQYCTRFNFGIPSRSLLLN